MLGRRITHFHGRRLLALAALLLPALIFTAVSGASAAEKKVEPQAAKAGPLDTRRMFGLDWHEDWKAAVTRNRVQPRKSRPIFFLRILGDLAKET